MDNKLNREKIIQICKGAGLIIAILILAAFLGLLLDGKTGTTLNSGLEFLKGDLFKISFAIFTVVIYLVSFYPEISEAERNPFSFAFHIWEVVSLYAALSTAVFMFSVTINNDKGISAVSGASGLDVASFRVGAGMLAYFVIWRVYQKVVVVFSMFIGEKPRADSTKPFPQEKE